MTIYLINELYSDGEQYESMGYSAILTEKGGFQSKEEALSEAKQLAEAKFKECKTIHDNFEKYHADDKRFDHTPPEFESDDDCYCITWKDELWQYTIESIEVH